ncbi:MAG: SAM-dependent chlorinase/fluorinase [Pseudomonadota bacterium]
MQVSGVITITTDFGHKGPFAAVMRGAILTRFAAARVVDLTHDIPAQWPPEAGFWVSRAYRYFPKGSVHLAIVDPGVGTERKILLAETDGHVFMAPDNGLLAGLLDAAADARVWHLDQERLAAAGVPPPSNTFHGRDLFAPAAAFIASGTLEPSALGIPAEEWIPGWLDEPESSAGRLKGSIVTVDSFGNLISNVDQALLRDFEKPVVSIAGHRIAMLPTYGRATPGDYLALVNSFGVVEIALAEGNAAEGLGLGRGAPLSISEGLET